MVCYNTAQISGIVKSKEGMLNFGCGVKAEAVVVSVRRVSGTFDEILVAAEDAQLAEISVGDYVTVDGSIRISRLHGGGRTIVFIFVHHTETLDHPLRKDVNAVSICGQLGASRYRKKTSGNKILVNSVLTVPGFHHRWEAVLPCLFWGSVGNDVYSLPEGIWVKAEGRIQSREYSKDTPSGFQKVIVREVSICNAIWEEQCFS